MATILYFAWVRDIVGLGQEEVSLPDDMSTVDELSAWLAVRSEGHAAAFADRSRLRVAVDQRMTHFSASITGAREIAFFPPVTGG